MNGKNGKIIFFDIDGTIIDDKCHIPPSAAGAIRAATQKGCFCVVNTGRPYSHIEPSVCDIGFDAYICSCGQHIIANGESIFRKTVPAELCARTAALAKECRLDAYYESEEGMRYLMCHPFWTEIKAYLDRLEERGFEMELDPFAEGYSFDKFCIWAHDDSNLDTFKKFAEEHFTLINRGGGMYECIVKGCSKAAGMDILMEVLGVSAQNSYAIGDSANDLPMLQRAAHGIAMGNAPENVKKTVEYVTSCLEEDGLARALEHFGLC